MTTDRQKSFVATVSVDERHLHFLDNFHGEPVYVTTRHFSGGVFTGRPQKINHSHFLALRPNTTAAPNSLLTLYFRYAEYGYMVYVRTPGQHYGKCLGCDGSLIGAFSVGKAAKFHVRNPDHTLINPENMHNASLNVFLQLKDSGLIHAYKTHASGHTYIADKGGIPLMFNLKMLERNAPYINHPNEL